MLQIACAKVKSGPAVRPEPVQWVDVEAAAKASLQIENILDESAAQLESGELAEIHFAVRRKPEA